MSKTITIIQLLNKIANGEEPPEKIRIAGHRYKYNKETKDYDSDIGFDNKDLFLHIGILQELNTPIIIEEQEDKSLQDILNDYSTTINDFIKSSNEFINKLKEK
jgi:hypothetical protein